AEAREPRAEAPRGWILAEEHGGLEARRFLGRQAHPPMRELADSIPADDARRQPLHLKAAADELQIVRARFQEPRRETTPLVADLGGRAGQRVTAEARAAAAERADRLGRAKRVAVADDHLGPGRAELGGGDLAERR